MTQWEVIVVGGGPGGALAAMKCAKSGLRTLLLEKKKIPRDKCCTGMVMGTGIQDIIREEFGEYPDHVVKETKYLDGHAIFVLGVPMKTLDIPTPATWRDTLDTWMCYSAKDCGAVLWDCSRVRHVRQMDGKCKVDLLKNDEHVQLESDYVIGIDSANSTVRRSVFPEYQPTLLIGFRECYDTKLDFPDKRFNIISTLDGYLDFFVTHRRGYMFLEGNAFDGKLKETIEHAKQYLVDNYDMQPGLEPTWRDGCICPHIIDAHRDLTEKIFQPAKGNVLLGGDASGMNIPITGEGIGTSVITGYDAAVAVIEAKSTGKSASEIYLKKIDKLLDKYHEMWKVGASIGAALEKKDSARYADAFLDSWKYSLTMSWWPFL